MYKMNSYDYVIIKPNKKLGYPFKQRTVTAGVAWNIVKDKPDHWFDLTQVIYNYYGTRREKVGQRKITKKDLQNNV